MIVLYTLCGATYWRQYFYRILLVLLPYIRSTGAGTTAAVVLALFPLARFAGTTAVP